MAKKTSHNKLHDGAQAHSMTKPGATAGAKAHTNNFHPPSRLHVHPAAGGKMPAGVKP